MNKLLLEGLGSTSFAIEGNHGRHVVTRVERNDNQNEIYLDLQRLKDSANKTCTLSGFW